jgi:hypothetical protein
MFTEALVFLINKNLPWGESPIQPIPWKLVLDETSIEKVDVDGVKTEDVISPVNPSALINPFIANLLLTWRLSNETLSVVLIGWLEW